MSKLFLYNSKTLQKEVFKELKKGEVSIYLCGPTVYNDIHIGNARPIVVFDVLKRVLIKLGYMVKFVSNYTDVDDKIINKAKTLGVDEMTLSSLMIDEYEKIRTTLNSLKPEKTIKVSETMDDIIKFIDDLVMSGYAYEVDGDVYFRSAKLKEYGNLSHQKLSDLRHGARIKSNPKKEDPLDFTLWKKTEEGIKWTSKYSLGRPGWHSECVVMIYKEFGKKIDIHAGGKDLRFPHHENELAQSLAHSNSDLANYWLHNGMLTIGNEKMSKSLGNLVLAKDFIKDYGVNATRWLLLSSLYRDNLNFSDDNIKFFINDFNKIESAYKKAFIKLKLNNVDLKGVNDYYKEFLDKLCDDLNTPNAYTIIYELSKKINTLIRNKDLSLIDLSTNLNTLNSCLNLLGIYIKFDLSLEDLELLKNWEAAKLIKDFNTADTYRAKLIEKGLI